MHNLSVLTLGDPSSPPLFFLHGFLGCKEDFIPLICYLQSDYYCVAFDLPGHGSSPFDPAVVSALIAAIRSFKQGSLVGYSLGGRLAFLIEEHDPELLHSIILISSHIGLDSFEEKQNRLETDRSWCHLLETAPIEHFLKQWYSQEVFHTLKNNPELYAATLEKRKQNDPKILISYLHQFSLGHQNKKTALKNFLFLFGEHDIKYRDLYRGLNAVAISDGSHAVHLENPEECAQQIKMRIQSCKSKN